jgi:hypothetical protein
MGTCGACAQGKGESAGWGCGCCESRLWALYHPDYCRSKCAQPSLLPRLWRFRPPTHNWDRPRLCLLIYGLKLPMCTTILEQDLFYSSYTLIDVSNVDKFLILEDDASLRGLSGKTAWLCPARCAGRARLDVRSPGTIPPGGVASEDSDRIPPFCRVFFWVCELCFKYRGGTRYRVYPLTEKCGRL